MKNEESANAIGNENCSMKNGLAPWLFNQVVLYLSSFIFHFMFCLLCSLYASAQVNPEDRQVDMDNPTFSPTVKVGKALYEGDSIPYVEMNNVYVYTKPTFKNAKQQKAYNRLVYNVKKVLPIAKECNTIIIETYEYLQTLPNKKAKDEHLKLVEQSIKKEYTPRMKKLT